MSTVNLKEIDRYDLAILKMPEGKWYKFNSVENERLLRYLVSEYHRLNLIEFTLNDDYSEFRKESISSELEVLLPKAIQYLTKKKQTNE